MTMTHERVAAAGASGYLRERNSAKTITNENIPLEHNMNVTWVSRPTARTGRRMKRFSASSTTRTVLIGAQRSLEQGGESVRLRDDR
jgi:hypothetical protein